MAAASKPVIPQNDNVAHALAGAGGGMLSMVLTYVFPQRIRQQAITQSIVYPLRKQMNKETFSSEKY
jgi:hypothetical protein